MDATPHCPATQWEHGEGIPDKWRRLTKILESDSWKVDRITGSHYIFRKSGKRCIPVAFHGGSVTRRYASLVLQQAGLWRADSESSDADGKFNDNEMDPKECVQLPAVTKNGPSTSKEIARIPSPQRHSYVTEEEIQLFNLQQKEKEEKKDKEALRRQKLLEEVQNDIVLGNYTSAVETISEENADFVGSSDENATFVSDIVFYQLVALTERAFVEHAMNSDEQHKCIIGTLKKSIQFIESFPARREDGRQIALALQGKVVQRYLEVAQNAFDKYFGAYEGYDSMEDFMISGMQPKEIFHSKEYVYGKMDTIVCCVQFVVAMYKLMNKSSGPVRQLELMESFAMSTSCLIPCIRKILISFDAEEYSLAVDVSNTIEYLSEKFSEGLDIIEMAIGVFIPSSLSKRHLAKLAQHIKALVPAYQFAKEKLRWSRYAGVEARMTDTEKIDELKDQMNNRMGSDADGVIHFSSMFLEIMRSQTLELLVRNNLSRKFMLDSLLDPILLIKRAVSWLTDDKDSGIGAKGLQVIKGFCKSGGGDLNKYMISSSARLAGSQVLKKKKYDKVRHNIIRLFVQLQQLVDLFSDFIDFSQNEKLLDEDCHAIHNHVRYKIVNETRYSLTWIMYMAFDISSRPMITLMILRQVAILQSDLDVAEKFSFVQSKMLKGNWETPEEAKSHGWWSFGLVIQTMLPAFLKRFSFKNERRQLCVIDRLGSKILLQGDQDCEVFGSTIEFEAIAFGLVSKLLSLNDGALSEISVRNCFLQVTQDKSYSYRRWLKGKARKYVKRIESWKNRALERREKLEACLATRQKCVEVLMEKMKKWIVKRRHLPADIEGNLAKAEGRRQMELVVKVGQQIHAWTQSEAREIQDCILELETSADTVTAFVHSITGDLYPHVKCIVSPSWSQHETTNVTNGVILQDERVLNTVKDVFSVHDVLHYLSPPDMK